MRPQFVTGVALSVWLEVCLSVHILCEEHHNASATWRGKWKEIITGNLFFCVNWERSLITWKYIGCVNPMNIHKSINIVRHIFSFRSDRI